MSHSLLPQRMGLHGRPIRLKHSHRPEGVHPGRVWQHRAPSAPLHAPCSSSPRTSTGGTAQCTQAAPACDQHQEPAASRRELLKGLALAMPSVLDPLARPPASAASPPSPTLAAPAPGAAAAGPLVQQGSGPLLGYHALRDPYINRGLATSEEERSRHQLSALLPPGRASPEVEVARAKAAIDRACTPLQQYQAIATLVQTDSNTCYALLRQDLETYLPIVYTPTVGDACLQWGSLLPQPTGLYLSTRQHAGRVKQLLRTWPYTQVQIAVITDGERILGLGDLGAHGMGIPTGKAMVYGACGLDPRAVLPVLVDAGCNTAAVRDDLLYVGERAERVRGEAYYAFMDEVVQGIQDVWGRRVLIHWEDVASSNSFALLQRLRSRGVPTFNDDIEATAVVTLAALLAATRLTGIDIADQDFLFFGAGQANLGCAQLLADCLKQKGLSAEQAHARVWLFDSKGLVLDDRPDLSPEKRRFSQPAARLLAPTGRSPASLPGPGLPSALERAIQAVRPAVLVGAASVGGAFGEPELQALAEGVREVHGPSARPTVLALSNPTSRAECTFEQALKWTEGAVVFASGTQFPPAVGPHGQTLVPAQANNCYVFPGLGQGCIEGIAEGGDAAAGVTPAVLLAAAYAIAGLVSESELAQESVLPRTSRLPEVAQAVAAAVRAAVRRDAEKRVSV